MSAPILTTKLYIPPPRPNLVLRPHLIERLNEGLHRKLTLVSAPAGFGKTTLVSHWIATRRGGPLADAWPIVAWLSLDESDSDATHFLTYLVAALQTGSMARNGKNSAAGKIGEGALALLQSPQPPPAESILTTLLNEITTLPEQFILVLDDYHVINDRAVDRALSFFLEHLPPQVHLVITTREDPNLPLARYRARSQLTEVRAADLRFTAVEAADFLNGVMHLQLKTEEIEALETRTEGWIAGLQLAAISLQDRTDTAAFIQAFTGSHHFILDYLVEEVLQRQPQSVRNFLLQTAILNRLSGPLCNAVAEQEDGKEMLETLARGNLFVIPLDDERQWYRYHHLFADVLKAHTMETQPALVARGHQRACEWYEQNDQRSEAIHHALAAADFARAAALIELAWPAMHRGYLRFTKLLDWLEVLPDALIRARPVLSVGYAWELLNGGELEAADLRLRDAERWVEPPAKMVDNELVDTGLVDTELVDTELVDSEMIVMDDAEFRALPAEIASARAYHALALGDVPSTITYARRALDHIAAQDHIRRGPAAALLGLAYWTSGELDAAQRRLADAMTSFQLAGNISFAISGTYGLADIKVTQGHLREAINIYQQSLRLATAPDGSVIQGTTDLHLGLGELYHEQNHEEAAYHWQRSEALGAQTALPNWPYRWCIAQARIQTAQGNFIDALELLAKAERLYFRVPVPTMRPIAALKARVWIEQGRLAEAAVWVREQGLSFDDEPSYLREFEHVTLARLLLAQYRQEQIEDAMSAAVGLLARLGQAAETGGRMGSLIEILLLQALAHAAQGEMSAALTALERALTLAEPEGYVRIFVDEGVPMARLLKEAAAQRLRPHYVDKLLAAFTAEKAQPSDNLPLSVAPAAQPLVEPLSKRELEVLQLVAQGFSNREISERLYLALDTVKGHNRRIFGKLQVQRRTEAVARGRELGLV